MRRTTDIDIRGMTPAQAIKALKKLPKKATLTMDDEGCKAEWDDGKKPPKYRVPKRTRPLTLAERMEQKALFGYEPVSPVVTGLAYWIKASTQVY